MEYSNGYEVGRLRTASSFYRKDTHQEAMKQSRKFFSKIQFHRIQKEDLMNWKDAKKYLRTTNRIKQ
jgi:hypothetical protein